MSDKKYPSSEAFHERYAELYDRNVLIFLKDGQTAEGVFCDEFFEDESILLGGMEVRIIKTADIARMEPADFN